MSNQACAEYMSRLQGYLTKESITNALTFKPRESDVFIVTVPKSGTTLTQMVRYDCSLTLSIYCKKHYLMLLNIQQ